jgi:hypothetical protein
MVGYTVKFAVNNSVYFGYTHIIIILKSMLNVMERDQWGDPDVDWRIILGWIFGRWERGVGT